ncbi:hypothetical protein COBT_000917 [Conglomerata obtusa]
MEKINETKIFFSNFVISTDHTIIVFYTIGENIINVHKLSNMIFLKKFKLREKITSITATTNLIIIASDRYVRGLNFYTGAIELFLYVKQCKIAYLLQSNKLVVLYDTYLVVYSVCNQIEAKFHFEKYKIYNNKSYLYFYEVITVFDSDFKVIDEIKINNADNKCFDFTIYNNELVYILDRKLVSKSYILDLHKYFLETPDTFIMSKNYIYFTKQDRMYFYDKKENKNLPLYLFADYKEGQGTRKRRIVNKINFSDRTQMSYVVFDMYVQFDDNVIIKCGDKLISYKEYQENSMMYIDSHQSYDYIEAECDFETSTEV